MFVAKRSPLLEKPPGAEVALNVYELHAAGVLNAVTEKIGLGGAYHVGLEVYWLEWSFGWSSYGSGVHVVHVGASRQGTFKERIPLGTTPLLPCEVIALLAEMRRTWLGIDYDVLRRNCGHFCAELARRLRVQELPDWVNSLARHGDWIAKVLNNVVGDPSVPEKPVIPIPGLWSLEPKKDHFLSDDEETEAEDDDDEESDEESCNVSSEEPTDPGGESVALSQFAEVPELWKLEMEWRWATEYIFERLRQEELAERARRLVSVFTRHAVLSSFQTWAESSPPRVQLPHRSKSLGLSRQHRSKSIQTL